MQAPLDPEVQARIERNKRLAKAKRLKSQLLEKLAAEGKLAGQPKLNNTNSINGITSHQQQQICRPQVLTTASAPAVSHILHTGNNASCSVNNAAALGNRPGPTLGLPISHGHSNIPVSSTVAVTRQPPLSYAERLNIKCELIAADKVLLTAPPHNRLAHLFRALGCAYDSRENGYVVSLRNYADVVKQLKHQSDLVVEALPRLVERVMLRRTGQSDAYEHYADTWVPDLNGELMPFQLEAVRKAIRWGRVLIADDMGLGKTVQAIAFASYFRAEWPVLVICPSSVRFTWEEAFLQWVTHLRPERVAVVTGAKDAWADAHVVIVSYEMMARLADDMKGRNFNVVIADESHMLKNAKAKRSGEILPILKAANRVVLLSGTPALSRPSELFTQLKAVRPDVYQNFTEFAMRYCDAKMGPFGLVATGASHLRELDILLRASVMIRRLKSEVATQLPDKFRQQVYLRCEGVRLKGPGGAAVNDPDDFLGKLKVDSCYLQMYKDTAEAKAPAVCDYVERLLDMGVKFLVFGHHSVMLDSVEAVVSSKGTNYIRIDGRTTPDARKRMADIFQNDPSCQVAILSIMAANAGITLTAASTVVFAELHWNPGILMQAEDRVHRIGQERNVNIQYLLAKGTIDSDIWPMLLSKLSVLSSAGLNKADLRGGAELTPTQGIAVMAQAGGS